MDTILDQLFIDLDLNFLQRSLVRGLVQCCTLPAVIEQTIVLVGMTGRSSGLAALTGT